MPAAKKATAAAVSRALTEAGFRKSKSYPSRIKGMNNWTAGFDVRGEAEYRTVDGKYKRVPTGVVRVSWTDGGFRRPSPERIAESLAPMKPALEVKGFTVVLDDGELVATRPTT